MRESPLASYALLPLLGSGKRISQAIVVRWANHLGLLDVVNPVDCGIFHCICSSLGFICLENFSRWCYILTSFKINDILIEK